MPPSGSPRSASAASDHVADADAAAHDHHVGQVVVVERLRGPHRDAVAGMRGRAVERVDRPLVVISPPNVVRHPKHFDRARERDHREVRQRQEAEMGEGRNR